MQQTDKNKFKYYNKCNKHDNKCIFFPLSFKKYNKLDEYIYTLKQLFL